MTDGKTDGSRKDGKTTTRPKGHKKGRTTMKMTKEVIKEKLEAHALWLNTRFMDNVQGERADLTGADLTDANLTDADLSYANLTDANLTGADLTGADLSYANLTGANLTGANLNIGNASQYVYDAIAASFSARMALKKTRIEWEDQNA